MDPRSCISGWGAEADPPRFCFHHLIHGDDGARSTTPALPQLAALKPDLVVFGHSHMPLYERQGNVVLFNPGSPVDPRRARSLLRPDPH